MCPAQLNICPVGALNGGTSFYCHILVIRLNLFSSLYAPFNFSSQIINCNSFGYFLSQQYPRVLSVSRCTLVSALCRRSHSPSTPSNWSVSCRAKSTSSEELGWSCCSHSIPYVPSTDSHHVLVTSILHNQCDYWLLIISVCSVARLLSIVFAASCTGIYSQCYTALWFAAAPWFAALWLAGFLSASAAGYRSAPGSPSAGSGHQCVSGQLSTIKTTNIYCIYSDQRRSFG